jgi:DNA topoisomerase I
MKKRFFKKKPYTKKPQTKNVSNAKYLVIVESPSKCSKIEEYLGADYACIASLGHIRHIKGLKSINAKLNYKITFDFIKEKEFHINEMRSIIEQFETTNILLGSDDDREGEAIAWHVCEVFNLPVETTKRIIFNEITKTALTNAVNNPTVINMNLVNAQQARQVLDLMVGYKISPFLWSYLYRDKENSLSAGRCQTPALRLIYENEMKQRDATCVQTYSINGLFYEREHSFIIPTPLKSIEECTTFLDESKTFEHKMSIGKETSHSRSAPKPFSTSKLLQTTNQLLNMSPHETMSICQQLYQSGFITYMRTESNTYSVTFLDKMKQFLKKNHPNDEECIPSSWKHIEHNKSIHPHEAIRVTDLNVSKIETNNNRLLSVYNTIRRNTIESCMSDYKYNCCKIFLTAPMELQYEHNIEIPTQLGWKAYSETEHICDLQHKARSRILRFQSYTTTVVPYVKIKATSQFKKNGSYYSEASLIQKLEELGIGRPSTFASIVQTIQERKYVERGDIPGTNVNVTDFMLEKNKIHETKTIKVVGKEKNKLKITEIGLLVLPFLTEYFEKLFSYDYTEHMESQLDAIVNGSQTNWYDLCKECEAEIKSCATPIKKVEKKYFPLEETYDIVFERYGPSIRHHLDDGTIEFFNVKKDAHITVDGIENNKYKLKDIIDTPSDSIGVWENEEVFIKDGRFGMYLQYGETRKPLKHLEKPKEEITWEDILPTLENKQKDTNVLRTYNESTSLRKGKFGPYIFHQTPSMKKPSFLNTKKYKGDCFHDEIEKVLEWVDKNHNTK